MSKTPLLTLIALLGTSFCPALLAAIVLVNNPTLPASADGFNITRDTSTGLDWLDVDVSVGRTHADLTGADGSNEFIAGGDFAGFRYATKVELTGAQNGPQLPSLFLSLGLSPFDYSSIAGYAAVRSLLAINGCFGACAVAQYFPGVTPAAYGYIYGTILENDLSVGIASLETFRTQGFNWGRHEPNFSPVFPGLLPPNPLPVMQGNWLVRATVVPLPAPFALLLAGMALLGLGAQRRR